jgi:hypothetical protein
MQLDSIEKLEINLKYRITSNYVGSIGGHTEPMAALETKHNYWKNPSPTESSRETRLVMRRRLYLLCSCFTMTLGTYLYPSFRI